MGNPGPLSIAFLALAVSVISLTITKSKVFSGIREKIVQKSERVGSVVICPYCLSHWISFLLVAVYRPMTVSSGMLIIDLVVSALVIVALATVASWVVYKSYKGLRSDEPEEGCVELIGENEQLRSVLRQAKEKLAEQNELIHNLTQPGYVAEK
jgi:FlaA1/EpsC-like NDP-sugar epimerase